MMLANYAEVSNGLLYISGGAWDTVTVSGPPPDGARADIVAVVQGTLVARLSFHPTELGSRYPMRVTIVELDGGEIANIEGDVVAVRQEHDSAPPTWDHGVTVIMPLNGLPLPTIGDYRIHFNLNREHKGDLPFRVVQALSSPED